MLLNQISGQDGQTGENPALRNIVLAAMLGESPLLNYVQFYQMTGNADNIVKEADKTGGQMRDLNADFASSDGTDVDEVSVTLRTMGDNVKTDLALERRGFTPNSERTRQLESFGRSLGRYFVDNFINGSGTAPAIHGIKTLCDSSQVLTFSSADGGEVLRGNSDDAKASQQQFVESIDELIAKVGNPTVLIMNAQAKARLSSVMREYLTVTTIQDVMGLSYTVTSYNNIPIIDSGTNKTRSAQVITNAETQGTSTDCTSLYAVKFGEREDCTVATNLGLVVKDLGLVNSHYVSKVELDLNVVLQDIRSVARLKGVRLPIAA